MLAVTLGCFPALLSSRSFSLGCGAPAGHGGGNWEQAGLVPRRGHPQTPWCIHTRGTQWGILLCRGQGAAERAPTLTPGSLLVPGTPRSPRSTSPMGAAFAQL